MKHNDYHMHLLVTHHEDHYRVIVAIHCHLSSSSFYCVCQLTGPFYYSFPGSLAAALPFNFSVPLVEVIQVLQKLRHHQSLTDYML